MLVLTVACTPNWKTSRTESPMTAPAPSAANTSAVTAPAPTPSKQPKKPVNLFSLRETSDGSSYQFHRLGDATLLLSVGLSVARIQGNELQWDEGLSSGLPQIWLPNVIPEIGTLQGKTLEGATLTLEAGCGTPPSDSGYPIEYEYVRKGGQWRPLRMKQRRYWVGNTHFHVESGYSFNGRRYTLMQADNPAHYVDGDVEDQLESLAGCIGTSLLVDEEQRPVSQPRLPKDLCVFAINQTAEGVELAGWDRQSRLVIELRPGLRTARASPKLPEGCHFITDSAFSFSFGEFGKATLQGSTRCAGRSEQDVLAYSFDGKSFIPEPTPTETEAPTPKVADTPSHPELPSDPERGVENPQWRTSVESDGVTWVLASSSSGGRCIGGPYDPEQVLYSSVPGPTTRLKSDQGLVFLEQCLKGWPKFAVLAEVKKDMKITEAEVARLAKVHHVPKDCDLVELMTDHQHAIGVPKDSNAYSNPTCSHFVEKFPGRTWCLTLENMSKHAESPEATTYYEEWPVP